MRDFFGTFLLRKPTRVRMAHARKDSRVQESHESIRQNEQIDEKELELLQQVATQVITASGMEVLYDQILDTALAILHADLASIQMVYPERGTTRELKLLGHRGFGPQATKRWEWVGTDSRTT